MPLSLTCACGASFELEDTFAGQEVPCPECRQPLTAPEPKTHARVTSYWALAAALLVLAGAFTVVGTLAGAACGAVAVVQILLHRDKLAGLGFALFGVVGGLALTPLTILALSRGDPLGVGGFLWRRAHAAQLEGPGPDELFGPNARYAVTRPDPAWRKPLGDGLDDPSAEALREGKPDLLLVSLRKRGYLDTFTLTGKEGASVVAAQYAIEESLQKRDRETDQRGRPVADDKVPLTDYRLVSSRAFDAGPETEGREFAVELRVGGTPWRLHYRLLRREGETAVAVARAYAPKRGYAAVEPELRAALDSFRLTPVKK